MTKILKTIAILAMVAGTACASNSKPKIAPQVSQNSEVEAMAPEAPNCFNPRFVRNMRTEWFISDAPEGLIHGTITEHDKNNNQLIRTICQFELDSESKGWGPDIRAHLSESGTTYWRIQGHLIVSVPTSSGMIGVANSGDLYMEYEYGVGWHFSARRRR